jgi:hypothetical protein
MIVVAIIAIPSCGGISSGVVANVDGHTITKTSLAHWIRIEAVFGHESLPGPQSPLPEGEVPDPPDFTACAGFLRTQFPYSHTKPTVAKLKDECRKHYEFSRQRTLQLLISYVWINAEAAAHHIVITSQQLQQTFMRFKHELFGGSEATFRRYTKYSTESAADVLFVLKANLQATTLQRQIITQRGINGLKGYYRQMAEKWAARTSCNPNYTTPDCKQYKGPQQPEVS